MALIEARFTARTRERPEATHHRRSSPMGVFARPTSSQTGWKSWLTTVDHKKIGIMYGAASLLFFFVGGVSRRS